MWPNTRVTKILKIKFPIIQAPMGGGITTPELVAAVSNAGALGSLGAGYMSPEDIRATIIKIRSLTDKPFAVNLFIPGKSLATKKQMNDMVKILKNICSHVTPNIFPKQPPYIYPFDEQAQVLLEEKVSIFSFTFGVPAGKWLNRFKRIKTKLIGTATNLSEARLLERKGIDLIVAQGHEAGGHRGTFLTNAEDALVGNFALLPQIVDHIKTPIIAAGGIMDARGILAALTLGASAVQLGTAFITCRESGAHPQYKKRLLKSKADETTLTRAFSGGWARGIKNRFIQDMELYQNRILDYPIQNALTREIRQVAAKKELLDYMSLWAGQAAYLCRDASAEKLIRFFDKQVRALIKKIHEVF